MVRNIYFCADFFRCDKRLVHIHISESAVNTDKGDVGIVFSYIKQLFVVKRVAAEIKRFILRFNYKPERLDRMVGKYGGYLEITYFYTVADVKRSGIFFAELFKLRYPLVCSYKILLGRYFRNRVGVCPLHGLHYPKDMGL